MIAKMKYHLLSWLGRRLYSLRLNLEEFQYYVDRLAGESLLEE